MTIAPERPVAPAAAPITRPPVGQRSIDPYDPRTTSENFDLAGWLATFEPKLLSTSEGRRTLTRLDPMLFAYIYLRKHLKDPLGRITFADAHFLWVRAARRLIGPSRGPREDRRTFVAPRACGKSTWWFLVIPMWAGAHKHARFAAAFADSGTQAELHLATFKREQSDNPLLRADFRDFCEPMRRHNGKTVNDSQQMLYTRDGFAFAARGIDATSLGMKVDEVRPDLLIFDDVEPPEGTYSLFQKDKRLSTIQNAILPLNEMARVILVGTVTMPGSLVHELVLAGKAERGEAPREDVPDWIGDERFRTHHTRPIVRRDDGSERSVWPAKWPMEYLNSIRKTRSFKLNFDNDPRGRMGELWNEEDFIVADEDHPLPRVTRRYLFIDPPVTMKKTSDPCGIALLGYAPGRQQHEAEIMKMLLAMGIGGLRDPGYAEARKMLMETLLAHEIEGAGPAPRLSRAVVFDAWERQLTGTPLKRHVLEVLAANPGIEAVVVENNQGGDLWVEVFSGLPCKLITYGAKEPKDVRFKRGLDLYQKRRVLHAKPIQALEDQMMGFPKSPHDDVADAVVGGVLRLIGPKPPAKKNQSITPR